MLTKLAWFLIGVGILGLLSMEYNTYKKIKKYEAVIFTCINEGTFIFKTDDPKIFEVILCKRG